jgi:hypothetical protein
MLRPLAGCISLFVPLLISAVAAAQLAPVKEKSKTEYSDEGAVIEESSMRAAFNADGTSTREQQTRVRIQSEAGVQQYGLLNFPYQGSVEHVDITYVRVRKSNGSVVTTPEDNIQEMPSEVSRQAPFYSDLREKHVAVKGLEPGTILEYAAKWVEDKPLAPGQFWFAWQFTKSAAVISEQLEVSAPLDKKIKVKSQTVQPTVKEEAGRRIYSWKTSNSTSETKADEKKDRSYQLVRGLLPPPDVLVSSFQSWEDVGRWYSTLQEEKVKPSPDVEAKAAELTKGLTDSQARVQALYDYVSLHYRYIGIAFGIGRYQPHSDPRQPVWRLQRQTHIAGCSAGGGWNPGLSGVDQCKQGGGSGRALSWPVRSCHHRCSVVEADAMDGQHRGGGTSRVPVAAAARQASAGYYPRKNRVSNHSGPATLHHQEGIHAVCATRGGRNIDRAGEIVGARG